MMSGATLDDAAKRLAEYRSRNDLSEILEQYSALITDFKRLKSDYEEEREGRERYKQLARGQERNPFVLVLIDGDGYIFNDQFLTGGTEGGGRAAKQLIDSVKVSLRAKGLENCDILVRVYADLVGLSKILSKHSLVGPEKRSLAPFTAGFNRSYGLTDFVDAGELKENADFKLKAMLRLYADNAQCKHIYFAACHDVGYVSELTPHRGSSDRITLVRSPSLNFHEEFGKLGFNIEEFPGVFRTTPLNHVQPPNKAGMLLGSNKVNTATAQNNISSATPFDDNRKVCAFYGTNKCKYGSSCRNIHIDNKSMPYRPTQDNSPLSESNNNWRTDNWRSDKWRSDNDSMRLNRDNGFTNPKTDVRQLPKASQIPQGSIAVNRNRHRLDAYISPPTSEAINRLKARSELKKLCNKKHIGGFCPDQNCAFDHSPVPPDLLPPLEALSRSLPCPRRGACRRLECVQGHICQKPDCKHRGGNAFCRLPYSMCVEDCAMYDFIRVDDLSTQDSQSPTNASEAEDRDEGGSLFDSYNREARLSPSVDWAKQTEEEDTE